MNKESLTKLIELMNEDMYLKPVVNLYNSIGFNLFVEIGQEIELPLGKGKREEWVIWISNSAWRITQDSQYIVGSGDDRNDINAGINYLLNRRIQKVSFTSDFLDLQIDFECGYCLNTFFNWVRENQWTIFMPNGEDLTAELSSFEEIKAVQIVAKEFSTTKEYISLNLPYLYDSIITNVYLNKMNELQIILTNNYCINIFSATWRIESSGEFLLGYFHDETLNPDIIFQKFIGKQITLISVSESLMDAVFQIGSDLTLKTFAFTRNVNQWKIHNTRFRADLDLCDL
jgi:hypothetical protein